MSVMSADELCARDGRRGTSQAARGKDMSHTIADFNGKKKTVVQPHDKVGTIRTFVLGTAQTFMTMIMCETDESTGREGRTRTHRGRVAVTG